MGNLNGKCSNEILRKASAYFADPGRLSASTAVLAAIAARRLDAYARRIVGWRVSRTARAGFVLDALEQALHERRRAIDNVVFQIRTEIADAARKLANERGEPPEDLEA